MQRRVGAQRGQDKDKDGAQRRVGAQQGQDKDGSGRTACSG